MQLLQWPHNFSEIALSVVSLNNTFRFH